MAISALNLPIDIPWTRVCVTNDMVDPGAPGAPPPLWQSSMALYRYVPPAEYQIYPGRRIIYYKLAATITNYQPRSTEVLGVLDTNRLSTGTLKDEEVKKRLAMSLPCSAAIVQVTVRPVERDRALEDFPYFMDVQPRQRALYEQVTQIQERASRSLETLQVRKDGATSNSIEVLDVDQGGGINAQIAGFGGGMTQQGQWGTKSIGKDDSANITTNDASREARETLAFTTQLSQMYTLLQAYHLGTNRVFFYIVPRPHTVEPPTGFTAPRQLDGVQDLFLVVSQAEGDALPCITARLDTGHLHVQAQMGVDRSKPPQTLTLTIDAPAPLPTDPGSQPTQTGSSAFYGCFFKTVPGSVSLNAPTGYVIDGVTDITKVSSGNTNFTHTSSWSLQPNADQPRTIVISGTATGYACFRNEGGDFFNFILHPSGGATNTDLWAEATGVQGGHVTHTVSVSFRSEVASVKLGDQYSLVLTTRQLHCCDTVDAEKDPPVIVDFVPVEEIEVAPEIGPPEPNESNTAVQTPVVNNALGAKGQPSRMSLTQVNALQRRLADTTVRLSQQIPDVRAAPAKDSEFVLQAVLASVIDDPRRARWFRTEASTLGLGEEQRKALATRLGRSSAYVTRFDVFTMPEAVLADATGHSKQELIRLRLEAAGLPTKPRSAEVSQETKI
jgi:hypothetical protein